MGRSWTAVPTRARAFPVNAISRSQRNGRCGSDSGTSPRDPFRPALRPSETIAVLSATGALDPKATFKIGLMRGR
jgi:hypothetical protein